MPLRSDASVATPEAISAGRLPGLLGFRVLALDEGRLEAELAIRPDLLAPNGYLHAATVVGWPTPPAATAAARTCLSRRRASPRSSSRATSSARPSTA